MGKLIMLGQMDNSDGTLEKDNRVYDVEGCCPTITCGGGNTQGKIMDGINITEKYKNYRIRKLTPLECWRLMDFKDEDFIKAATVVSNAQLYKQAGNSIVVNVLVAIIGQMIEGKEEAYKECV